MLHVEDVIDTFNQMVYDPEHHRLFFDERGQGNWLLSFTVNVNGHVLMGKPLSTEQSKIILKHAAKHRAALLRKGLDPLALDGLLHYPVHRQPPYPSSNVPREVRYIGDNKLAFRFKFNETVIADLKTLMPNAMYAAYDQRPTFNGDRKIWVISVTRSNIERVIKTISTHFFRFDEAVAEFLTLASNSRNQPSTFVLLPESNQIVANVCDNDFLAAWVLGIPGAERL